MRCIWDKVWTKNELKNGPSKICGKFEGPSKSFKGYLPQILLGSFLNTLSHLEHTQTTTMELFCENSQWLEAYFCKKNSTVDVRMGSYYTSVHL